MLEVHTVYTLSSHGMRMGHSPRAATAAVVLAALWMCAASEPLVPREMEIPCYSPGRSMFMWTDFQCHDTSECGGAGGLAGVDVGRMVDFNEKNPLAPAQPCRCISSQSGRRSRQVGDTSVLPDNCGVCSGYAPLAERASAFATAELADDWRCAVTPRGNLDSERSPETSRDPTSDVSMDGDFFCQIKSPECRASAPVRTVDTIWLGADATLESGATGQSYYQPAFYGYSDSMAVAAEGVSAFDQCGPYTDLAHTLQDARCRCSHNADSESSSWAPPLFGMWMDTFRGDPKHTMCHACSPGYRDVWGDWTRTCHLERFQCAAAHPDAPMLLTSALAPSELDLEPGVALYRCVDPDSFCSPGSEAPQGYAPHDTDASVAAGRCVCNSDPGEESRYGNGWRHPDFPELGLQTVCTLCNNEAGHFALGESTTCQWTLEHYLAHPEQLGERVASMATYRLDGYRNYVFDAWHHAGWTSEGWDPRWPAGLDWPGDSDARLGIVDLWPPYPVPVSGWITLPGTGSAILPAEAQLEGSEYRGTWFHGILERATAEDATPEERAVFTWWACGQAAAPQIPGQPLACRCLPNAGFRPLVTRNFFTGFRQLYPDDCLCHDGYAFDRDAVACVPHAQVCGGAAMAGITYMCVCLPEAAKDDNGRCTVCKGSRFRPLDACPLIHEWCGLPSDSLAGVDVSTSKASATCTCDAAAGLRPFNDQRDGVNGCHSCVAAGSTFLATAGDNGACVATAAACPDAAGRLDAHRTEATSACTCQRGWGYSPETGCDVVPPGHWVDASDDSIRPWAACGPGVDESATGGAGACVCDVAAHWEQAAGDGCVRCAPGFIMVRAPGANVTQCLDAVGACGTGVDEARTHAALACRCGSAFLPFSDQPSGRCEDCVPPRVRRAVDPAACHAPRGDDLFYGGALLDEAAYTRLLDMAFEDGASVFNDDTPLDCGAVWTEQTDVWAPHYVLHLPSTSPRVLKTVTHNLEEIKLGCYAYFPCTGFATFVLRDQHGIQVLYVVYFTSSVAHAAAPKAVVYTPHLTAYTAMVYSGTWEVRRAQAGQCDNSDVDPAWYWSTWHARVAGNNMDFVAFSEGTLAAYGPSVRAALAEPAAVVQHFLWRGHLLRLWPNPGCKLGPLPADARTACRAQSCPTFSDCPFDFPVGGGPSAGHLCFTADTTAPASALDVSGLAAAWPNSTHDSRDACREGVCLFDVSSAPGSVAVRRACACPGTGMANPPGHACDTAVNRLRDEGSGVCRFPLLTVQEKDDCGTRAGEGCPPGRFGVACALFDVDSMCAPAGASAMCSGHGTCTPHVAPLDSACACEDGWTGKFCSYRTCDQGCGPFGKCVAEGDAGACLCAVHKTLGTPLSLPDPITGRCDIDLCNDHLGGSSRRYGSIEWDAAGAQTTDGAPYATCACTANAKGIANGGPLCDEPACAGACGLAGGTGNPAYADVCIRCDAFAQDALPPECDVSATGIGAVCDCDGTLQGGVQYWVTQPWKFDLDPTPLAVLGREYAQCAPWCGTGGWDAPTQACVCTDASFRGDRCDQPSCPNGEYSQHADECVRCKTQFRLLEANGRLQCLTCAVGYEDGDGGKCQACAAGFLRTETAFGPVCRPCDEVAAEACSAPGTASHTCSLYSARCACAEGYSGEDCSECVAPFWRVTAGTVASGSVNATVWPVGACAPLGAWDGCDAAHTAAVTLPAGAATPACTCTGLYSNEAGLSLGDRGDCSVCRPGFVQHAGTGDCVECATALQCDASGTLDARCPNPGRHIAGLDNGLENACVCDMGGGRTGERCEECSVETKWVPVPNTLPLLCHHCDRDCGPNGEVMCGVSATACACRGAWTGARCDRCVFCGQGGRCLPAENQGDPWCECLASQGYTKDAALVGTPGEYRAACTSCRDGFFMHGIRCMAVAETCGPGADAAATKAAQACVCRAEYLPMDLQTDASCVACAVTHYASPDGCGTCSPACGVHAACAWNEVNERHGCECVEGWAEHNGECTVCAEGYFGPDCVVCPDACGAAGSGGTCVWNDALARIDCACPEGTTHTHPGATNSPCRPCDPDTELGPRCVPLVTCPSNARSTVDGASAVATCVCLEGYVRAFEGGTPLLTPCVAPEVVAAHVAPPVEESGLFDTFDLASLSAVTAAVATGLLVLTAAIALCFCLKDRWARKPAGYSPVPTSSRPVPRAQPRAPPQTAPTALRGRTGQALQGMRRTKRGLRRGGPNRGLF